MTNHDLDQKIIADLKAELKRLGELLVDRDRYIEQLIEQRNHWRAEARAMREEIEP